MYLLKLI